MRSHSSHSAAPRRLTWLLWLALLLPLAQAAAAWHGMSHAGAGSDTHDGKAALHLVHCNLCLTAAALGSGALPAAPPAITHPAARHQVPQGAGRSGWLAPPAQPYQSRAPPFALR